MWKVYFPEVLGSDAHYPVDGRRSIRNVLQDAREHIAKHPKLHHVTHCVIGAGRLGEGKRFSLTND